MNDALLIEVAARRSLDADRVASKLWVGSVPPRELRMYGFNMVVLCAEEHQMRPVDVQVIKVPLFDAKLTPELRNAAITTAMTVTAARKRGMRVLVTCAAGANRSAFIAALSMLMLEKLPLTAVIHQIRAQRKGTPVLPLSNPYFIQALNAFELRERR